MTTMHSALYIGEVWHRRLAPRQHEFMYNVFMVYLDLAELPEVFNRSRLWADRSGQQKSIWPPVQFRREDFFCDFDKPLGKAIRDWVAERTGNRPTGPIRMLANLRIWGYQINPIICYYIFDETGKEVRYVIAEVTNTPWQERVQYLLACDAGGEMRPVKFDKQMHVSPFNPMEMVYHWQSNKPGEHLRIQIDNEYQGKKMFNAAMTLQRSPLTQQSQRRILWQFPWMTAKVALAIYWQALRLFLKRVPLVPHPKSIARNG